MLRTDSVQQQENATRCRTYVWVRLGDEPVTNVMLHTSALHLVEELTLLEGKLLRRFALDLAEDVGMTNHLASEVHASITGTLIRQFLAAKGLDEAVRWFASTQQCPVPGVEEYLYDWIHQHDLGAIAWHWLLEAYHLSHLRSHYEWHGKILRRTPSRLRARSTGAVYTPKDVAAAITRDALSHHFSDEVEREIRILDLGAGTGRFYFAALDALADRLQVHYGGDSSSIREHIIRTNLYAIDTDPIALDILKVGILERLPVIQGPVDGLFANVVCKDMLTFNDRPLEPGSQQLVRISHLRSRGDIVGAQQEQTQLYHRLGLELIDYRIEFPEVMMAGGFDVVVANPPYVLLKVNSRRDPVLQAHTRYERAVVERLVRFVRQTNAYQFAVGGMLNTFTLSIELALRLLRDGGSMGIICPSTLFGDASATRLRRHLLLNHRLVSVQHFPERENPFEDVIQAVSIIQVQKGTPSNVIQISTRNQSNLTVHVEDLRHLFGDRYEVPFIDQWEWELLRALGRFPKLGQLTYLRNRRGELDLTLMKDCITSVDTGFRLVRGRMVVEDDIREEQAAPEFVDIALFLSRKSMDYLNYDYGQPRLVCQQVSNMNQRKRLRFALSKPNHILANSCNYITPTDGSPYTLETLKILLNSYLLDWRFRVTSTNNHINNYELDELPLPFADRPDDDQANLLSIAQSTEDRIVREVVVARLYGLPDDLVVHLLLRYVDAEEVYSALSALGHS